MTSAIDRHVTRNLGEAYLCRLSRAVMRTVARGRRRMAQIARRRADSGDVGRKTGSRDEQYGRRVPARGEVGRCGALFRHGARGLGSSSSSAFRNSRFPSPAEAQPFISASQPAITMRLPTVEDDVALRSARPRRQLQISTPDLPGTRQGALRPHSEDTSAIVHALVDAFGPRCPELKLIGSEGDNSDAPG